MPDFKQKFYDITHLVQREFERNLELYGDKIQCRKGCSKCCSQIFRITSLDGWIIGEHVKSLPEKRQQELKQKAKEYIEQQVPLIKGNSVARSHIGGFNTTDHHVLRTPLLGKEGTDDSLPLNKGEWSTRRAAKRNTEGVLPCPALGAEGECTIYEARPVICRRFGPPIYDYKNPANIHACELNFKDGEEITDNMLIPNQTEIGKKWDELKDEYNSRLPLNKGEWSKTEGVEHTTIAEAILKS